MKRAIAFVLLFFYCSFTFSQGNMKTRKWRKTEVDSLAKASLLFEEGSYIQALPLFQQMMVNHPKELYLKYVLGICSIYRSDTHGAALELLLQVYAKNKKANNIQFDLAKAYHYNYKFDEALALLDPYLKNKKITEEQRKYGLRLVEYCNNAKILYASPVSANIENVGDVLNSVGSEYVPVISSDESVMFFTYTGDMSIGGLQNAYNIPDPMGIYYEDVFSTYKELGNWIAPSSLGSSINTEAHDAAIAISNDGQKLFIYKDNSYDGGDVYLSQLEGSRWSEPEKLKGDINTSAWEGSVSLSSNEKIIYFSSERPGGFGGRDLYCAYLLADGTWGNVKNLGDKINTIFDDDAPFIHPDGRTLIYSSQGLNSMGDYDIFTTEFDSKDSTWSTPKNLGYPINTPDDDRYFVLSVDGKRGYYASGKVGGYGLQDIYVVAMPEDYINPVLIMLKGKVTVDSIPALANISVLMMENMGEYGTYNSNAETGNYLINLQQGHNYKVTYSVKGFADKVQMIDAINIKMYIEKNIDFEFNNKIDSALLKDSLRLIADSITKAIAPLVLITSPIAVVIPDSVGNGTKEGLVFKVQIAAYNLPKNYSYDHLKGLGDVEKLLLNDGITRFTIGGSFKTFNEALAHKVKVKAAGQTDAFVTAIYHGERVYLEHLAKMGLIPAEDVKK